MNPPQVIEFDRESILLGWKATPDSLYYELQMTTDDGDDPSWTSLSSSLTLTIVRKKNLVPGQSYR
jgi:hypothetical protein